MKVWAAETIRVNGTPLHNQDQRISLVVLGPLWPTLAHLGLLALSFTPEGRTRANRHWRFPFRFPSRYGG